MVVAEFVDFPRNSRREGIGWRHKPQFRLSIYVVWLEEFDINNTLYVSSFDKLEVWFVVKRILRKNILMFIFIFKSLNYRFNLLIIILQRRILLEIFLHFRRKTAYEIFLILHYIIFKLFCNFIFYPSILTKESKRKKTFYLTIQYLTIFRI